MGIILKFIIKSMSEKKVRTFLIILAVILSGALCFVSLSVTDSLVNMYIQQMKRSIGNAEIKIESNENSPSQFISLTPSLELADQVEYIIPVIEGMASYDKGNLIYDEMSILGIDLDNYERMNELHLNEVIKDAKFGNEHIIISTKTAEKYNLEVGQNIQLMIGGSKHHVTIYAIADSVGIFGTEVKISQILISFDTLSRYYNTDRKPTKIYLKTLPNNDVGTVIEKGKDLYSQYDVKEAINNDDVRGMLSMFSTILLMMTCIITIMSVFIIYTSFRVIMLEKMPIIGTFRSVGASKKVVTRVLVMESMFYGVVGGVFSIGAGILILKIILNVYSSSNGIQESSSIYINPIYVLVAFLTCILICVVSSIFPILKVSKIPIKEIVLNNYSSKIKKDKIKNIVCMILTLVGVLGIYVFPKDLKIIISYIAIPAAMIGIIGLLPLIIKYTAKIIEKLFEALFGNIGVIAIKNVRVNKSILNSVSLIGIGVSILLMVNNLGENLSVEVFNAYDKYYEYDIELYMDYMDKNTLHRLRYEEGVSDCYGNFLAGFYFNKKVALVDKGGAELAALEGVVNEKHGDYLTYTYSSKEEEKHIFNELQASRNITFSNTLKNRYNLELGEVVKIDMPQGIRNYKIIGFFESLANEGNVAQIGYNYFKQDIGENTYESIYLKTSDDANEVLARLQEKYKNEHLRGDTLATQIVNNEKNNVQILGIIKAFSILAMVIGIIGVINNLLISFIERKRSLAMYRSIGMNKKQVVSMIFLEALYSGIVGSVVGITIGWIIMNNLPYVAEGLEIPPVVYFVPTGIWVYIVMATIITVVASILPAIKTSKLNIIESIKCE